MLGVHSTRPPSAGATSVALGGVGTAALDLDVRGKWLLPVPDSDNPIASSTAEGSIDHQECRAHDARICLSRCGLRRRRESSALPRLHGPTHRSVTASWRRRERWSIRRCAPGARRASGTSRSSPRRLDLGALQSTLLGSSEGGELLRQLLDRIDRHSVKWPDLSGTVQIGELSTGKLVVHDAIGAIDISGNSIRIRSLNGHVANGTMHLAGVVDASGDQPEYQLDAAGDQRRAQCAGRYLRGALGQLAWPISPPNSACPASTRRIWPSLPLVPCTGTGPKGA